MIGEVSHFQVLERVGEGGMGVVYRAVDTALKREVALKFINQKQASEEGPRKRFIREAQTAASLNHPNICTIHEVGEIPPGQQIEQATGEVLESGTLYIAMEFLKGEPLRTLISKSDRRDLPTAIDIAIPIATGLAAAHAEGIVHRDLKPSNVMISADGRVKILDFGLAKPSSDVRSLGYGEETTSAFTPNLTQAGDVAGTVWYMSPEQASGKPVDSRSDVFSFGTLLYEIVVGVRPFVGDTPTSTVAKIIESDPSPPLSAADLNLPPELTRIIQRCLRKSPDDRFNDTRDLVVELKDLRNKLSSNGALNVRADLKFAVPSQRVPASSEKEFAAARFHRWGLITISVAALGAIVGWISLRPRDERAVEKPTIHRQLTFSGKVSGWGSAFSLSSDCGWIAYCEQLPEGDYRVLVQDLGGGAPIEVLEGLSDPNSVAWSPSGTQLLVSGEKAGEYATYILPRVGGAIRPVRASFVSDWSPDGNRFVGAYENSQIHVVDIVSAEERSFNVTDSSQFPIGVDWSPADRILVLTATFPAGNTAWTVLPDGSHKQMVLERGFSSPRWGPSGNAIYYISYQGGDKPDLMKIGVNTATGRDEGEPETIIPGFDGSSISVSADGTKLLYSRQQLDTDLWVLEKVGGEAWDSIRQVRLTPGRQGDSVPSISPDGQLVAFNRWTGIGPAQVFTVPLCGGEPQQITFLEGSALYPVWSPDGTEIAFTSYSLGGQGTHGLGKTQRLGKVESSGGVPVIYENPVVSLMLSRPLVSQYLSWAPGPNILYQRDGNHNYHLLDPDTEEELPLIKEESTGWVSEPRYSPDSTTVAVAWDRTNEGLPEGVWAISMADGNRRLLAEGQMYPLRWSADGEWVYAQDDESNLLRIPASGGDPELLLKMPFEDSKIGDISPDGSRVVVTVLERISDLWMAENFDPGNN